MGSSVPSLRTRITLPSGPTLAIVVFFFISICFACRNKPYVFASLRVDDRQQFPLAHSDPDRFSAALSSSHSNSSDIYDSTGIPYEGRDRFDWTLCISP